MTLPRAVVGFVGITALLGGCEKREPITTYAAPKEPQPVAWIVPQGWQQVPHTRQLQYAAFKAGDGDDATQITVSFLHPDSPGASDLLLNINRWRGQLGLEPVQPAEVGSLVQNSRAEGGAIQTVELTGKTGNRMRAAIVPHEDRIWFYKMTGPAAAVEAQKQKFDDFVKSAKYQTAAAAPLLASSVSAPEAPPDHSSPAVASSGTASTPSTPTPLLTPQATTPGASNGEFTYALPAGWTRDSTPRPMRVATLSTGGDKPATIIVTRLSNSFGSMKMNLDRWRGEVGLPPVQNESEVKETSIKIGSAEGRLVDLSGPGRDGATPTRSLIARRSAGDSTWFFKILGPDQSVSHERENFEKFLASVQLPDQGK